MIVLADRYFKVSWPKVSCAHWYFDIDIFCTVVWTRKKVMDSGLMVQLCRLYILQIIFSLRPPSNSHNCEYIFLVVRNVLTVNLLDICTFSAQIYTVAGCIFST